MTAIVECHSGYEYAERPTAVYWEGKRYRVLKILAQWRNPDERCFRVQTEGQQTFELFYNQLFDEWRVNPA